MNPVNRYGFGTGPHFELFLKENPNFLENPMFF
jgi:hypothetical protein